MSAWSQQPAAPKWPGFGPPSTASPPPRRPRVAGNETVQNLGGRYVRAWWLQAVGATKWRVMLELAGPDGTPQVREVGTGERSPTGHAAATPGLGLAEGKAILAALQRLLVAAQVDEHRRDRRRCDRCGAQRPLKDLRPRRLVSLFGVAAVRAPRCDPCRCGVASAVPFTDIISIVVTPPQQRTRGLGCAPARRRKRR
jgi:hypothetical protein